MPSQNNLGTIGEIIAANYLREKGYKILETNWIFNKKEIDIIACKDEMLVIVEVKARDINYIEEPKESVKRKKQRNLTEAADAYIQKKEIDLSTRFDIISVVFYGNSHKLEHIEDAFYPLLK